MGTLLVRNATVLLTMDDAAREIADGGLFARDGFIEAGGPTPTLLATADTVIDPTDQVVLPGLINAHHHLDQTLTRALPAAQDADLFGWLRVHYPIWRRRDPDAFRTTSLVGMAELALSGCTTVFDHAYLFANGCRVDDQVDAARAPGMRFVASRGSMSLGQSRGGLPPDDCVEDEEDVLADSGRVIAAFHDPAPGAMQQVVLAPCSPFSVTEGLMRESAALARAHGVRLHTHLCETRDEERFTLATHGVRPIDYVERLGWLTPDVWCARDARERGRDRAHGRLRLRHVPLPELHQHAARLGKRAGAALARGGREGVARRGRLGEQRRQPPAWRGAAGDAAGAPRSRPARGRPLDERARGAAGHSPSGAAPMSLRWTLAASPRRARSRIRSRPRCSARRSPRATP